MTIYLSLLWESTRLNMFSDGWLCFIEAIFRINLVLLMNNERVREFDEIQALEWTIRFFQIFKSRSKDSKPLWISILIKGLQCTQELSFMTLLLVLVKEFSYFRLLVLDYKLNLDSWLTINFIPQCLNIFTLKFDFI